MEKLIEIQDLQKSFTGRDVLKGIDLTLNRGENVVLLGRSGIGKTVLIKCIVGLILPDSGIIRVFGENIEDLNDEGLNTLRKKVGFLFQGGAVYDSMTVRENLEFPIKRNLKIKKNKDEIDNIVHKALENVGLLDAIDKMPSELSGGMRKRVGLARTLILNPEIILYDEPTTGLDPITSKEIIELILEIQKKYNTSSIIITHDIHCIRSTANHILLIKNGIIYAEGTLSEFMESKDKEIKSYFS
ncbi:MAG: ATP-binding cassette domain-containing protein [Bacteroidales bacterium]|nr:ATP-binding cassette domain-containing protein [Bacteroidales bacterium]